MATDIKKIIENLFKFIDFTDQTVISVGAGGGQFIEYGRIAKRVLAIDNDKEALSKLENNLVKSNLCDKFTLINADFNDANVKGDILMFEFCLHEMNDPEEAIKHALAMAPVVLITDHWPNSPWAYIADEEKKVINSWKSVEKFDVKRIQRYDTLQSFHDFEELYQKVKGQGENSIRKINLYRDKKDFIIPMSYGFAII